MLLKKSVIITMNINQVLNNIIIILYKDQKLQYINNKCFKFISEYPGINTITDKIILVVQSRECNNLWLTNYSNLI